MTFEKVEEGVFRGGLEPATGELGAGWRAFGADVVVGHPTFQNERTVGRLLAEGIRAARSSFGGRRVAFVVTDGSWTAESADTGTLDVALEAARGAMAELSEADRQLVRVVVTPYEGYGGDRTPGKGSALKMVFDELGECDATMLVLLDGDLRNDMGPWHRVFARIEGEHEERFGGRPFFVTARYARHFVDASLTRFIVGPLTTLMGTYVPGGISGDIALSAGAVAKERAAEWTSARRRYGTDIATTFDNVADGSTVIYEAYLGAKLHDITDEAKLSMMPAQVIGAALERLLHWQEQDGRITALAGLERQLGRVVEWPSERTGIGFVDPGATDAFDIDVKTASLVERLDDHAADLGTVHGPEMLATLRRRAAELSKQRGEGGAVAFLGVDRDTWIDALHRAVAYVLRTGEVEPAMRALNYLYTAAFLDFVKDRLADLGLTTVDAVRRAQGALEVPPEGAEAFYAERVDAVALDLSMTFFARREKILHYLKAGGSR